MRAVYVLMILLGLSCPQVASAQRTSAFGQAEREAIEQLFDQYTVAFRNEDYAKLRNYIQVPFVRFGPSNTQAEARSVDWVVLESNDDALNFFRMGRDALKAQGLERFEWGQTQITALSADRALVNKTYRRYRNDGTVIENSSIYVVSRSSGSWKMCGILNQDLDEFGKIY